MRQMSGAQLEEIRLRLGYSRIKFGRMLGYRGGDKSVLVAVTRMENGTRKVGPAIARLALMLDASQTGRRMAKRWAAA